MLNMRSLYFTLLTATLLLIIAGCSTTSKVKSTDDNYLNIAKEKFGDDATFTKSPDDSYVLCMKEVKGTATSPQNHIDYFAYDLSKAEVVLENSIDNGKVGWYSGFQLEVVNFPGTMAEGQTLDDYTKIINLKTGKSVSKRDLKQKD